MAVLQYLPSELAAKHESIRSTITVEDFFRNPKHQRLREEWCAANFAQGYYRHLQPCLVYIEEVDPQNDTDFELGVANKRYPFQITEVQEPNRRRSDEYKNYTLGKVIDEDWSQGTEEGPTWIKSAIEKKLQRYGSVSNLNLLVYVNFPAYEINYTKVKEVTEASTKPFASVWLLTGDAMACLKVNPDLGTLNAWLGILQSAEGKT